MVLPSTQQSNTCGGQNDFLDFFSQAIERYKNSVMEGNDDVESSSPRSGPTKERSPTHTVSDEASDEKPAKTAKISSSDACTEPVDSGTDGNSESNHTDTGGDVEKKRLASRVSSRRTREREKLRMDHFRNAKLKLQQEKKKLQDENDEIRGLIKKIKDEKAFLGRKTAVVQSMLGKNSADPSHYPMQGLQGLASSMPNMQQQQQQAAMPHSQQALAALLLKAIVQPRAGKAQAPPTASMPPAQPSQEQQLLSLLGLMSTNPALSQLLNSGQNQAQQHQHQMPQQQQPMMSASLQGNFASAPGSNQSDNSNGVLQQTLLNLLLSGGAGGQGGGKGASGGMYNST